jgi:hypothetical protein
MTRPPDGPRPRSRPSTQRPTTKQPDGRRMARTGPNLTTCAFPSHSAVDLKPTADPAKSAPDTITHLCTEDTTGRAAERALADSGRATCVPGSKPIHSWRKFDKRCGHRAGSAPRSAGARFRTSRRLGAGERIRTADRPLTRSIALRAVRTCKTEVSDERNHARRKVLIYANRRRNALSIRVMPRVD